MVYLCKHTFSKCVKGNLVNAEQNKVQLQQRRNYDRTQSIQSKYYYIAGQIWPTILSLTSELLRHPACIEAGDRKTIVRFIDLLIIVPGLCKSLKFKVSKSNRVLTQAERIRGSTTGTQSWRSESHMETVMTKTQQRQSGGGSKQTKGTR